MLHSQSDIFQTWHIHDKTLSSPQKQPFCLFFSILLSSTTNHPGSQASGRALLFLISFLIGRRVHSVCRKLAAPWQGPCISLSSLAALTSCRFPASHFTHVCKLPGHLFQTQIWSRDSLTQNPYVESHNLSQTLGPNNTLQRAFTASPTSSPSVIPGHSQCIDRKASRGSTVTLLTAGTSFYTSACKMPTHPQCASCRILQLPPCRAVTLASVSPLHLHMHTHTHTQTHKYIHCYYFYFWGLMAVITVLDTFHV